MRNRKPFELDGTLAAWNFMFSLFSGVAAYKLIPELIDVFRKDGFVGESILQKYARISLSL